MSKLLHPMSHPRVIRSKFGAFFRISNRGTYHNAEENDSETESETEQDPSTTTTVP